MLCLRACGIGSAALLAGFLLFAGCVSTDPKDSALPAEEVLAPNKPVETVKPEAPLVIIYEDKSLAVDDSPACRNGYFRWLPWSGFDQQQDRRLSRKYQLQIGSHPVTMRTHGDPMVGKLNLVPTRMFEEDLAHQGHTYPYQGLIFHGEPKRFQSELELEFTEGTLNRNYILTIGQLFRYTNHALTEIVLTIPGLNINESFDFVQSAAAYRSRDFDAPLKLTADGDRLRIIQDGPTGRNSGFLFLRPKEGVELSKLHFEISSARWEGAHPDQLEIGVAQLFCGERACQKSANVLFYDPGHEPDDHPMFSKDALLILGDPSDQASTHFTSLGQGGRVELQLDGLSANRDGPEIEIHLRKGRCIQPGDIRVRGREFSKSAWVSLPRIRVQCDRVLVDLFEQAIIRELQIENTSVRRKQVIDIDAITCRD